MSRKEQIRDYTSRAEMRLREIGTYSMPNDEPGLAHAVYEELQRMYPGGLLSYDKPKFGGETVFRSSDHLGFKKPDAV